MSKTNQEFFGSRLVEMRKKLGMTQRDLSGSIGVSVTSIQNYENGQVPGGDVLIRLARVLACSPDWLVTGEGEMKRGQAAATPNVAIATPDVAPRVEANIYNGRETLICSDCEITMVPMVEARLSAGNGSFETSTDSERRYAFRSDFLRRKGHASAMVLMRVAGDSMEPDIKDNDVVLIDTANTTPRPGRLFAIAVEDLVYLKKVDAEPGKLVLTSANPAYAPLEIDARGDLTKGIRIIGKAVWVGRELD